MPEMTKRNNVDLPEVKNWDHYWALDETERFTKISWSKRRIMQVIEPYLRRDLKILDAGCGSGFFSKFFIEKGLKTISLDYSPQALDIAQKKTQGKGKVIQADLLSGDLVEKLNDRVDFIFSDGLLEHFPIHDQDQILKNFISILNPRGMIITFVPNRFSPWELIRPFYMPGIEEMPFTFSQLIELNQRHDLKLIASGGINTFPFSFSPDRVIGKNFGMLLYTIAQKA